MEGFKRTFNSTTVQGRANVAKATYASFALLYLYYRFMKKKTPPTPTPPPSQPPTKSHESRSSCQLPTVPPTEEEKCQCPCSTMADTNDIGQSLDIDDGGPLEQKVQLITEDPSGKEEQSDRKEDLAKHPFTPFSDVDDYW